MPQAARTTDEVALHVFLRSLDAVGGSRNLVQNDLVDWLPDLMRAAYVVTLQNHDHKVPEEIAQLLNLSRGVVENILTAPTEAATQRIQDPPPLDSDTREETAGGVAKFAYGTAMREEGERSKPLP